MSRPPFPFAVYEFGPGAEHGVLHTSHTNAKTAAAAAARLARSYEWPGYTFRVKHYRDGLLGEGFTSGGAHETPRHVPSRVAQSENTSRSSL